MRWKKQLLELSPYKPGKSIDEVKKELGLDEIVKLASNENPYGCSKNALSSLMHLEMNLALYPDGYASNLRAALAASLNVRPEQLIFGNGSDEIIQIISRALLQPGSNTVMASPTFPQYRHNAILEGAECKEVPLIDGEHDLEKMLEAIDDGTRIIWLCSPNNPTGTYISESRLYTFLDNVPTDVLVVLDEAYYEYVVAEDYHNTLDLIGRYDNVIALRTFSKIYGLASLRIGYGIAHAAIITALEPAREPFNTSSIAQFIAKEALQDTAFLEECKKMNREGLQQFYQFCTENDLHCFPSQGNFVLIDFGCEGDKVFQFLLSKGFIVRSGNALGFPTSVRITVGSPQQNEGVLKAIKQFLVTEKINNS